MAGYREQFIHYSKWVSPFVPHRLLTKLVEPHLLLPVYHTVSDDELPHINQLYTVKNTKDFIDDLDFLLKHYEPIDFPMLITLSRSGERPKKNYFYLTFDDGLREFKDVIAPILIQKGISGGCFLNNYFIDNEDLFYRYKASLLINKIKQLGNDLLRKQVGAILQHHNYSENGIQTRILNIPYASRHRLDDIATLLDIDFRKYLQKQRPYLSTAEIRDLAKQGFHFGAHSLDHPEYFLLTQEQQLEQTVTSIKDLEDRFNFQYKTFAFPFTDYQVSSAFFVSLHQRIPDLALTLGSAGLKHDRAARHLQRIPMEMKSLSGKQIIHGELIYYLSKKPFGRNYIIRK